MDHVFLLRQPCCRQVAVMGAVVVEHQNRRPRIPDVRVHRLLQEFHEILLVGRLGEPPVQDTAKGGEGGDDGHRMPARGWAVNVDGAVIRLPDFPFLIPEMGRSFVDVEYLEPALHVLRQSPAPLGLVLEECTPLEGAQHLVLGSRPPNSISAVPLTQTLLGHSDIESLVNFQNSL